MFKQRLSNVLSTKETVFLHDRAPYMIAVHDRAPCIKALATQSLLTANNIDYFGNAEWPGSSPDLNSCENVGAIIKKRVEDHLRETPVALEDALEHILRNMEYETELFISLLQSYPSRLEAVTNASGGNTRY